MRTSIINAANLGHFMPAAPFVAQANNFRAHKSRGGLNQFVGGDETGRQLGWSLRRRIMAVLRVSCRVMGPGQKSRIGRLGGGAAIGAIIAGFSVPVMAQSVSGGNNNGQPSSLAIGTGATTAVVAGNAVAVGNNASVTSFNDGTAIGASATTTGGRGVAVGTRSRAQNNKGIAIGVEAQSLDASAGTIGEAGSIAIGETSLARANGTDPFNASSAVAIGIAASATADGAVAFGEVATATSYYSSALGAYSTASGLGAVAVGGGSTASANGAIAIGGATSTGSATGLSGFAKASAANAIALGTNSISDAAGAVAIGLTAKSSGINGVSLGVNTLSFDGSIAIGASASADHLTTAVADGSIAIGPSATATGGTDRAIAIGAAARVNGTTDGIAIGSGATSSGATSLALGRNAQGAATDAIAIGNQATASTAGAVAIGLQATALGGQAVSIGVGNTANGDGAVAIGDPNVATGQGAVALGRNNTANGQGAVALGNTNTATGIGSVAIGNSASSTLAGSVALGNGSIATAIHSGAFTLNGGTAAGTTPTSVVSVGTAAAPRQIQNVAAGVVSASSTDAVNGSQLFTTATAANNLGAGLASSLGGGASVAANGTLTNPNYIIGGTTYTDVGSALGALASASAGASPIDYANAATPTTPNGGTPTQNATLVGAAAGPVTLANVAAGSTTAGSTQAVNGGQLNTGLGSVATNLGGGSAYNPVTGTVTAPSYTVQGVTSANVGAALGTVNTALTGLTTGTLGLVQQVGGAPGSGALSVGAATGGTSVSFVGTAGNRTLTGIAPGALSAISVDAVNGSQVNILSTSIASNIGGGSTFNPATGTVSAPSILVGGTTYTNLSSAISAAGAGFKLTTGASGSGVANGTSVQTIAPGDTATITAGNNIITTQTGANVAVALNPALTGITSLAITGGPTLSGAGITLAAGDSFDAGGNKLTNIAAGSTAAGSTDAVNGSQINTGLGSVATNLGGGSTYNPVTGTVTAPSYTVQGVTSTNVGAALGTVNTALTGLTTGTLGLVQQVGGAPGSGALTVGATTGGTSVSLVGTAGNRTLTGVAPGALSAASVDAVNGSQINALGGDLAAALGGGASFNPATGLVNDPAYNINGSTYNNVGAALADLAGSSKYTDFNSALAAANASGTNASAVGPAAQAAGNNATALGAQADASGNNAVATGTLANASGTNAVALGANANASGNNSVALGAGSQAGVNNAGWAGTVFAGVTQTNNVNANAVVSVSGGSTNRQITGVADGAVSATSTDAVSGSQLFAVGTALDSKATNLGAGLAVSLGGGASVAANGTVTNPSYTVGGTAFNNVGSALGALQSGSPLQYSTAGTPTTANGLNKSQNVTLVGAAAGPVTLDNVAPGSTLAGSTQAVNGGQLNTGLASVAANLGGGSTYNPATGVVTAPTYTIGGNTFNDVGTALGSLATGGAVSKYVHVKSVLADSTAVGNDSVAIGPNAAAINNGDVALGSGALSSAAHSGAFSLTGGTITATAPASVLSIGATGSERQIQNVAAGVVSATSTDGVNGSQLFSVATSSVNLGNSLETVTGGGLTLNPDGTIASPAIVTVGGVAYNDLTSAIEAGDAKADAANAGLASALGGGAAVGPDGTVTAPSYTLGASTFTSVGAALSSLASGTTGLVQQVGGAPGSGQITVGAATGGSSVSVAGTAGNRTVTGVAAGTLGAVSSDAVNGGQLFATNTALTNTGASLGGLIGGGAVIGPNGTVTTAPTITVGGVAYNDVTSAVQAGDGKATNLGAGLAASLGGGASVAPNGTLTAPRYTVQGSTYANVGDALAGVDSGVTALKSGAAGLIQFSTAGPARTTPNGGVASQNAALVGATAGQQVTLSNLAGGEVSATSSDAINGAQLFALGTALGGGSTFGPGGTVIPPNYSVNGSTYTNAGDAFAAVNQSLTGGGIKYFHASSTLADSAPVGQNSVAVGPVAGSSGVSSVSVGHNANASADNSVAIGTNSIARGGSAVALGLRQVADGNGAVAIGDPNTAIGTGALAIGADNNATGQGAVALGNLNTATGQGSVAIGNASSATLAGSVALGDGAVASAVNAGAKSINGGAIAAIAPTAVVSVGAAGSERQIQNVAAGVVSASSTNAVNGSQLFAVGSAVNKQGSGLAAALGGGANVAADGTVTAPAYTVQGATVNNVGAAIGAVDTRLTSLANGTTGIVQQAGGAPGAGVISVGGATGGTTVSVAGTAGNRLLTGVANGSIAAGSNDGVNGGQLAGVAASAAATSTSLGQTAAAALGGGSAYDPAIGRVSAPSYSVGGRTYGNVGAALGATNALAVQYVADASGQPTNAVRLSGNGNGQAVGLTNVAAGALSAGSTDAVNGGQLFVVQQIATGAVQYDRNPDGTPNRASVSLGTAGTPVSLGNVAAGVRASDAVNLGQLQSSSAGTLAAANSYTDGRITALSFDLRTVAKRAYAGTAAAIALQAPQLFEPGAVAVRFGAGVYRGEYALGASVRATGESGKWSLSGGISGGPNSGVAASAGIDFLIGN